MTSPVLPASSSYRRIALALAQALERQHERLAPLSNDDEPQEPRRRLADPSRKMRRESDPLTRRAVPATKRQR